MNRRDLAGRLVRLERDLGPRDGWQVWLPAEDPDRDDGTVTNPATGERATPADVRARPGRHILVEYVDAGEGSGP